MGSSRSPAFGRQFTIDRLMLAIAVIAVVLGLATYYPAQFAILLFVGINVGTFFLTRPSASRASKPVPGEPRRFRYSIWQVMAVAVVVAVILAIVRASVFSMLAANAKGGGLATIPTPRMILGGIIGLGVGLVGVIYAVWFGVGIVRIGSKGKRGGGAMFGIGKKKRREELRLAPFPPGWSEILEANVPIYGRLSELDRAELRGLIQVFLDEKVFEGCGGLTITDEIRVTIVAQACLLLLRRETDIYPKLITILVYPSAYVSNMPQHGPHGIVTEGPQGRLGEAWTSGVVVLSWDDVKMGAADVRDGHNVVFHEFAHQLDQEDGSSDGAPILPKRNLYSAWARVLGEEYDELRQAAETGKKSVLDTYGATEPAEFFAVATEAFFEKPVQLKKKHPELYEELKMYYSQDPEAEFIADCPARPKL